MVVDSDVDWIGLSFCFHSRLFFYRKVADLVDWIGVTLETHLGTLLPFHAWEVGPLRKTFANTLHISRFLVRCYFIKLRFGPVSPMVFVINVNLIELAYVILLIQCPSFVNQFVSFWRGNYRIGKTILEGDVVVMGLRSFYVAFFVVYWWSFALNVFEIVFIVECASMKYGINSFQVLACLCAVLQDWVQIWVYFYVLLCAIERFNVCYFVSVRLDLANEESDVLEKIS